MARNEEDDGADKELGASQARPETPKSPPRTPRSGGAGRVLGSPKSEEKEEDKNDDEDKDEEIEEEEEEPLLKYTSLTKNQGGLYRNGDAVSACLVAGDKMIVGTHNGSIHVFALPSFQPLKVYRAHSAAVTTISISPYPPPLPTGKSKAGHEQHNGLPMSPHVKSETAKAKQEFPVQNVPSNQIHIATSSIDGHIVVQSLVEGRDILRRNFGRPVHTVALSPDFKNDRTYLSGGMAGSLVQTVGGTIGKTTNSTTIGGAAAAAQGWLGTVGLGGDEGKDTVLHSGEGKINTVRWSLSGKYVVWVNEQGIKIMRSHLHLEPTHAELAWKRISHIDRPNRIGWDEMAGLWKARAEWVDEEGLESEEDLPQVTNDEDEPGRKTKAEDRALTRRRERLLVGWGGSIWIMDVFPGEHGDTKVSKNARLGRVEVVTILRTDCIISGVSLYTPSLLLVLAYINPDDSDAPQVRASPGTPSGGRRRRNNAQRPEMRIIDIRTKEEVSLADTLNVSRYESLTAGDYHMATLPVIRSGTKVTSSKGALEVMGEISSNLYGGMWDVAMYPKNLLSSSASVKSSDISSDKVSSKAGSKLSTGGAFMQPPEQSINPALLTRGMKVFVHSPYDCVLATKPTISDHLKWLEQHEKYEEAWNLVNESPEAANDAASQQGTPSSPDTPTKGGASFQDFYTEDLLQTVSSTNKSFYSTAEKEKRRIGDQWVGQLIKAGEWQHAGEVCGKVLDTTQGWEKWFWEFAHAGKYAEITSYLPVARLPNQPPLSSTIYEAVFGHYIARDPPRFAEVMDTFSVDLFDVGSVITAVESRLREGDITENSIEEGQKGRYWRILLDGLAKLYLAAGRYRDALHLYIRLQDAETALSLIKTQHLADAVVDDVPSLILLRISKDQLKSASTEHLDEASADIIQLLVIEAYQGIIPVSMVVTQLQARRDMRPFLFFYLRALWTGVDPSTSDPIALPESPSDPTATLLTVQTNAIPSPNATTTVSTRLDVGGPAAANRLAHALDESRALVNDVADVALPLFAQYSRPLFSSFLRSSQSYTLSLASQLCEKHDYVPELVHLLAKEGRANEALHLILERLGDMRAAVAFAREQADPELWEEVLQWGLGRAECVRVLLEEAGSGGAGVENEGGSGRGSSAGGLDPVKLIRRIPEGMEIEGLKQALGRMLREFELRESISSGVARVCRGEVHEGMRRLRAGQKKGLKFEIGPARGSGNGSRLGSTGGVTNTTDEGRKRKRKRRRPPSSVRPGYCAACGEVLVGEETKTLISYPCSHVFHLPCLILYESMPPAEDEKGTKERPATGQSKNGDQDGDGQDGGDKQHISEEDESNPEEDLKLPEAEQETCGGVAAKVRYAKVIRGRVAGGCPLSVHAAA